MENKSLTFETLLNELKNNNNQITKGSYIFKELTHKQQRKILNGNFESVEIPAKLSNIYSEYIGESIEMDDDMSDITRLITVDKKPYFINMLRVVTFGDTYYHKGDAYKLYEVQESDLICEPKIYTITANKFKINLKLPTIAEEEKYNNLLIIALAPHKNKSSYDNINMGAVTDLYQNYELLKYMDSFEFNGEKYRFAQYSIQERLKFLNHLPQITIEEIKEYIETNVTAHENIAMSAFKVETNEKIIAEINALFFSSTIRKDASIDNDTDEEN